MKAASKREFVSGRETRACIALYRCLVRDYLVWVLAIRGLREAGHTRGSITSPRLVRRALKV